MVCIANKCIDISAAISGCKRYIVCAKKLVFSLEGLVCLGLVLGLFVTVAYWTHRF